MNDDFLSFGPGFGAQIGHFFESGDEFRPAIGVSGIIDGVCPDEKIQGSDMLGISEGQGQKNCIPGRNIGRGNFPVILNIPVFGYLSRSGQSGTLENFRIDRDNPVSVRDPKKIRDFFRGVNLTRMALTIEKRQCMAVKMIVNGGGQGGR